MRWIGLLLGFTSMPEGFEIDTMWEGELEIEGCLDGEVTIALSKPDDQGQVEGICFYVSTEGGPKGSTRASYPLHGTVEGNKVVLQEGELLIKQAEVERVWRYGVLEMQRSGDRLSGSWTATSGTCVGTVELVLQTD